MKARIETKETSQRLEQLALQPIQDYITTCLTLATNEGLTLLGRQGGAIYQSQGGLSQEPQDYAEYTDPDLGTLKVPYVIIPPEGNVGTLFYSEPPTYPFETFPNNEGKELFTGYYGISKLPQLYKISALEESVSGSIQENLETYIAGRTASCADWKSFEGKGYKITPGTATATLVFALKQEQFIGEQYFSVELLWPVDVTTPAGDKAILKDFAARIPVRLATIYYTIKTMIDGDVTDISYKPESTFSVTTLPHNEDSFVIIKDAQSQVGNKPFEFWLPRKNRRPALWQIDTEPLQAERFHVTPEGRGAKINVVKIDEENSQLEIDDPCPEGQNPYVIKLKASDPDENEISYEVHLPRATDNEIPLSVAEFEQYKITVYAKDNSKHPNDWFDSQEIPLKVGICEVR